MCKDQRGERGLALWDLQREGRGELGEFAGASPGGWSDPGGGRTEPVRVREGVWQGRSRQKTPRQQRMSEQEDRSGVMVTFQGRTSHTSPALPPQLFSYTGEENLGSLSYQYLGDSVICSLTQC